MPGFSVPHSLSEFAQPMLYCSLQHQTFTTRHIHNWVSFLRWPSHFILSGAISNCPPLFSSSILNTFQPGGANLLMSYVFVLSYCLQGSRHKRVVCHSLPTPVDHVLSELFTMLRSFSGALHSMAHSFIELCKPLCHDKAVIHEEEYLCYWLALFSVFFILKIRKKIFPGEQIRKYMCTEDLPWWLRW